MENSVKITRQQDNQFVLNLLLNCINKNGKKSICKNLLFNSSINIGRHDDFIKTFENLILKPILPFKVVSNKKKLKYIYTNTYRSISSLILNMCKFIKKSKKKVSFDFYFQNEINKLLNKNSISHIRKKQFTTIFKSTSTVNKKNIKKKLEKNLRINIIKKKKLGILYLNKYLYYNFVNYNNKSKYIFSIKRILNKNTITIYDDINTLKYLKII